MRLSISIICVLALLLTATAVLLAADKPADKGATQAKYVGIENCKMCHPDIHGDWNKTAHAKTYAQLVNVGEEKNPKCLVCHSTGYGKGGFVDAKSTPELAAVTCEACHGPGSEHNGDAAKIVGSPAAKTCAGCHQKTSIHSMGADGK